MNYKQMEFWFLVAQWGLNLVVAGYLWIHRKHAATNHRLKCVEYDLAARIEQAEKAVVRIQAEMAHLPSQKDLERLSRDMIAMTREMADTRGQLRIIGSTASLINDFLIHEGSKNKKEGTKNDEQFS